MDKLIENATTKKSGIKFWEIYHYIYKDVCDDDWFGKKSEHKTIGFVGDTEDNVKNLVSKLNSDNHSYCKEDMVGDDFGDMGDYDENYISYAELKINSLEGIEDKFKSHRY